MAPNIEEHEVVVEGVGGDAADVGKGGKVDKCDDGVEELAELPWHERDWTPYEHEMPFGAIPLGKYASAFVRRRQALLDPFRYRMTFLHSVVDPIGWTVGELLTLAVVIGAAFGPLAAFLAAANDDNLGTSGQIAGILVALIVVLATRTSVVSLLFGISWERQLKWHKLFALISLAGGAMHGAIYHIGDDITIRDFNMATGWAIVGLLGLMILASAYPVRLCAYQLFKYSHAVLAAALIILCFVHSSAVTVIGLVFWLFDLSVRGYFAFRVYRAASSEATVTRLPAGVVRISIPNSVTKRVRPEAQREGGDSVFGGSEVEERRIDYKAGQYFFVCVPELSRYEWHPLSVSSSPHHAQLMFHARALGDWSRRLYELGDERVGRSVEVLLEGPYGNPMVDIDGPTYDHFILVSGGIGITPMQSIYNSLLDQLRRGRPIRKIRFVWSVRDAFMIKSMFDLNVNKAAASGSLPLSFQPEMLDFINYNSDARAVGVGADDLSDSSTSNSANALLDRDKLASPSPASPRTDTDDLTVGAVRVPVPFSSAKTVSVTEFYLTRGEVNKQEVPQHCLPCVADGRVDLDKAFEEMRACALEAGSTRVAVLTCGPAELMRSVRSQCVKYSRCCCGTSCPTPVCCSAEGTVTFDYHGEAFEF